MRRRPRAGDLVLLCAIVLLAAAAVARLNSAAAARTAGVAAFWRDSAIKPGRFSDPQYRRAYRVVAVCALHRPAAGGPPDYRLCGVLRGAGKRQRVGRWYRCRLGTRCVPPPRLQPGSTG